MRTTRCSPLGRAIAKVLVLVLLASTEGGLAQIPLDLQRSVIIPHSLETDVPGQVAPVCWGWLGTIYYQHVPETGVGPDYFKRRVIDEPWKWGANLLEMYSTNWITDCAGHHVRPLRLRDASGLDAYEECPDPRWTDAAFRDLYRHLHKRGMLSGFFACERLVPDPGAHPFVSTNQEAIDANIEALKALTLKFSDCLTQPTAERLDGFGWECWFHDNEGRTTAAMWEANPGMYSYSTAVWPERRAPNYLHGFMCAVVPQYVRGRDDHRGLPETIGTMPLTYQADCRARKQTHPAWKPWSPFTGGTYPDWILKQAEDFFRRSLYAGDNLDAQAIWWLGEPEALLPDELRPYVYAATLDPIRHAMTTNLWVSGIGGFGDCVDDAVEIGVEHRYDVPFDAAYIGNNYVRVYREQGDDRGRIMIDPTHTGHFDNDSLAEPLFVETLAGPASSPLNETILDTPTPAELIVPTVASYEPSAGPIMGDVLWTVGQWDVSSKELRGEQDYEAIARFEIGDPNPRFPSLLADSPRGPTSVQIRYRGAAESAVLLVGQLPTSRPERVTVRINGKEAGAFHTVTGDPQSGSIGWCHRVGPFALPGQADAHVIELVWDGQGGGFAFDAVALCRSEQPAIALKTPDYPDVMNVAWTPQARLPCGLSSRGALPRTLTLTVDLEPGRYLLGIHDVRAVSASAYTMRVDGEFGPGFGVPAGGQSSLKTLAFTVHNAGSHELEFVERLNGRSEVVWGGFTLVREHATCIAHTFDEPGGHLARMTETIRRGGATEHRTYMMINDFPAVQVDVRFAEAMPADRVHRLPFAGSQVDVNGDELTRAITLGEDVTILTLRGEGSEVVAIVELSEYPAGTKLTREADALALRLPVGAQGYRFRLGVNRGRYPDAAFVEAMRCALTPVPIRAVPATVLNKSDVPLVRVLKIENPPPGPYSVREQGADGIARWIARGAQPSVAGAQADYLRVYLQPQAEVNVDRFGLFEDAIAPAPGHQKTLAISSVRASGRQMRATVRVMQISPMLFAPSVRWAGSIRSATVNGQPWRYFEGAVLHLPLRRGDYDVEVTLGTPTEPYLMRTGADVARAAWDDGQLRLEWAMPSWCDTMPGDLAFTVAVDGIDAAPRPGPGYEIVRREGNRAILRVDRPTLSIPFD